MRFQEVKGELMVAGIAFFGIGALGAAAGNVVGQHANDRTAFEVAAAGETLRANTNTYLDTAGEDDCRRTVFATILARDEAYEAASTPEELAEVLDTVCGQEVSEDQLVVTSKAFSQVQEARRTYREMVQNADYSREEQTVFALAGFIGAGLVAGGVVGAFKNLSDVLFE